MTNDAPMTMPDSLASLAALEPALCKLLIVSAAARGVGKTRSWLITKWVRRGTAKNMPKKAEQMDQSNSATTSSLGCLSPIRPIRYMAGMAVMNPAESPPAAVAAVWQTVFSLGPKTPPVIRVKSFKSKKPKMEPHKAAPKVHPALRPVYMLLAATTSPKRDPTRTARL